MIGVSAGGGNFPQTSEVAVAVSALGEDVAEAVICIGDGLKAGFSVGEGEHPAMSDMQKLHNITKEQKIVKYFLS
jgi:hypothetical protein